MRTIAEVVVVVVLLPLAMSGIYWAADVTAQTSSAQITTEVENLIRSHPWNQDLMQHLVDDYEIVYPFQVRDRSRIAIDTRNYYFTNATIHFDRCTFVIKSSYNRFKLHLAQNRLLVPPGASYKQIFNDSFRSEIRGDQIEHCYYQGEVHNEDGSKVALSTCDGLRGVIITGNETYFILPLKGGDLGRRHAHVLLRAKLREKLHCSVNGLTEWRSMGPNRKQTSSSSRRRSRRDGGKETKYIELAIIADQRSFADLDASFHTLTRFVLEAVNGMDLMFSEVNTRVTLVHLEVWKSKNPIELNDDITQTMLNFVKYASTVVYSEKTDAMLLMTSKKFLRQESTMSIPGSVCSARATGIVSTPNHFEEHQLSVLMTHTVAHILGMKHDDETCNCPNHIGCLMSQSISGRRMRFVHQFSSCGARDYDAMLDTPQARCLFNKPLENSPLVLCGNGVVDDGEQCDCGSVMDCDLIDPCCDPVTCTLRNGAECGAGPCCRDCNLLPTNHLCRASNDECDVPEFCTSKSGQCPPDATKLNGDPCDGDQAYCYNGKCASGKKQCVDLWGAGADRAENACFTKFNVLGVENGNCGYNDHNNKPVPCPMGSALCGMVHCKDGSEVPSAPSYFKMEFAMSGKTFECKVVTMGSNSSYKPGMVMDGAKCGVDKVCLNRDCVYVDTIAAKPECPTNNVALPCSGHGVCTSEKTCFCNSGWVGEDCGRKPNFISDNGGVGGPALFSSFLTSTLPNTTPSLSAKRTTFSANGSLARNSADGGGESRGNGLGGFPSNLDTYTMFIILGGVAGAVFIILLLLVLCYRRRTRTNLQKKLRSKKKNSERESDASFDTAHRSIRFGDLPSYRGEKMQMKQHKKRTLHQISETDEKDSISTNKSRESAHSSMIGGVLESMMMNMPTIDEASSSKSPERGILKNGAVGGGGGGGVIISGSERALSDFVGTTSPLLGGGRTAAAWTAADGYESEPPAYTSAPTCRVFQNSLRRLNECDLYRGGDNNRISSTMDHHDQSASDDAAVFDEEPMPRYAASSSSAYHPPPSISCGAGGAQLGTNFSPTSRYSSSSGDERRYAAQHGSEGSSASPAKEYACGNLELVVPHSSSSASSAPPPPATNQRPTTSSSSPESVASAKQGQSGGGGSGLIRPQPLKLKNIEYLLRQLEQQEQTTATTTATPMCYSVLVSPSSSTTEMSATEADKVKEEADDQREEAGSNTESHRGDEAVVMVSKYANGAAAFGQKYTPSSPVTEEGGKIHRLPSAYQQQKR